MSKFVQRVVSLTFTVLLLAGCSDGKKPVNEIDAETPSKHQPNFLIIVADDLGFSDLGAFGGEIETPNLDALALSGIRFTSFYTAPTCSPTRSMLLTGQDSHAVGLGAMEEALPMFPELQGKPGYEGYLNPSSTSIAEKFSSAGYRTMMAGKWHLGTLPEQQPNQHGFEKSFVLLQGGGDHFGEGQNGSPALMAVNYTENGKPANYPIGKYSSDFYAEKLIEYMNSTADEDRPFMAYLAFTAPHWPLQAPKDLIAKYKGKYDGGPVAKRDARLKRMKALGLLDSSTLAANLKELISWEALSDEERALSARKMEIYAAMVDSLDQNVGKVLKHLKSTGEFENTIVIFMSDNGAEGTQEGQLINMTSHFGGIAPEIVENIKVANADIEKMGTEESFLAYGNQWGQAAMAPFREHKAMTEEGGVKSPAFISGPGVKGGRIVNGALSVRDIMPTTLDLAGVPHNFQRPELQNSETKIISPRGISWLPIINGASDEIRDENDAMAWELFHRRAVRLGDWKAVYRAESKGFVTDKQSNWSWRLYNLRTDPGESQDVKLENPEVFSRLMKAWDAYAKENGVVEIQNGTSPH